ncbi:response regulator [Collimonas antrihumi]|uniref:response regulator n=1 Tax=Collimonas antrihumi TaxID=1940615 RepID=UPI001B8CD6F7|nr:response regulator [Collimonas antrihumi]
MKKVNILVADAHPVVATAVKEHLGRHPGFSVHPSVANSTELFDRLSSQQVDVLVTAYIMPGGAFGDGLTMLKRVRKHYPTVRIIVFTSLDSPRILTALKSLGINSIISKRDAITELVVAIDRALRGTGYHGRCIHEIVERSNCLNIGGHEALSVREAEVLRMYLAGHCIAEIANSLKRSVKTIYNQRRAAMAKLSCKTDAELFQLQSIHGIVT